MSEPTISLPLSFFKEIDYLLSKIRRTLDQQDIAARTFKQLSKNVAEMDTVILTLRQEHETLCEALQKVRRIGS